MVYNPDDSFEFIDVMLVTSLAVRRNGQKNPSIASGKPDLPQF